MALMAFQWNLLEDILDYVQHIATSFNIVGALLNFKMLHLIQRKLVFSQHIFLHITKFSRISGELLRKVHLIFRKQVKFFLQSL